MNNLGAAKRLRKELQSLEKAVRNGDCDDVRSFIEYVEVLV